MAGSVSANLWWLIRVVTIDDLEKENQPKCYGYGTSRHDWSREYHLAIWKDHKVGSPANDWAELRQTPSNSTAASMLSTELMTHFFR
jgi:hypothetical protein